MNKTGCCLIFACMALGIGPHTLRAADMRTTGSSTFGLANYRPPAVDPTYGLPRPRMAVAAKYGKLHWPEWIWTAHVGNRQTIYLRRVLPLAAPPQAAELYVTADNRFILYINGRRIAATGRHIGSPASPRWRHPRRLTITADLHAGNNVFAIRAKNRGGAAGIILWLLAAGRTILRSNSSWRVTQQVQVSNAWTRGGFNAAHWARASVKAPYGRGPWKAELAPWPVEGTAYMAHLYFQPIRVSVLRGRSAFHGLKTVARQLSGHMVRILRPGYQGRSRLAPALPISLTVDPAHHVHAPELLVSFGQEVAGRIDIRGTGGPIEAHPAPPVVQRAVYGVLTDPAHTRNVTALVRKYVQAGRIAFPVNQIKAQAGNPAPGKAKALRVQFLLQGRNLVRMASDGQTFHFPLPRGVLIGTGESKGEAMDSPWGTWRPVLGGWNPMRLNGAIQHTPWSAFRYAVIRFAGKHPIHLNALRLNFKYYPVTYRGAFDCSDPMLNRIWYTGAYTAHLCMQERIWDGPKRDRAQWMGDLQVSGGVISDVFLDHFLMQLTMNDLRRKAQGGRPADQPPVNDVNGIPGYSCAWIVGLADYYRHTGALTYVKSQHEMLLSMLRYMKTSFGPENLFTDRHNHRLFIDWSPPFPWKVFHNPKSPSCMATDLYTCLAVKDGVFLLRAIGDAAQARRWLNWYDEIVSAARRYLANRNGTFTNIRQVNAMAIYSGVADRFERRAIYRRILAPRNPAWRQIATPYYNYYVICALGRLGRTREALNFIRRYWGGMLREGATTFWEVYTETPRPVPSARPAQRRGVASGFLPAGLTMYRNSLCHGWSAGVTNFLTAYILGVRPTSGGFATAAITPHLGNLRWVSGRVPTPHGDIVLSASQGKKGEELTAHLPPGVRAVVGIKGREISINGQLAPILRTTASRKFLAIDRPGLYTIIAGEQRPGRIHQGTR